MGQRCLEISLPFYLGIKQKARKRERGKKRLAFFFACIALKIYNVKKQQRGDHWTFSII